MAQNTTPNGCEFECRQQVVPSVRAAPNLFCSKSPRAVQLEWLNETRAHGPHRLVVRTSRRGRDNPGSTPGVDIFWGACNGRTAKHMRCQVHYSCCNGHEEEGSDWDVIPKQSISFPGWGPCSNATKLTKHRRLLFSCLPRTCARKRIQRHASAGMPARMHPPGSACGTCQLTPRSTHMQCLRLRSCSVLPVLA